MAPQIKPCARRDLQEIEIRLRDQGFGHLLAILPRELFELHQRSVVINPRMYPLHHKGESPVFAYIFKSGNVGAHVNALRNVDRDVHVQLVDSNPDHKKALNRVSPLQWISGAPDHRATQDSEHTQALIKFFLLRWASNEDYTFPLPLPDYEHLSGALARIMESPHYITKATIDEDKEQSDMHMSLVRSEVLPASENPQLEDRQDVATTEESAQDCTKAYDTNHTSREELDAADKSSCDQGIEVSQQSVDDIELSTPDPTHEQLSSTPGTVSSVEGSPRDAGIPSAIVLQDPEDTLRSLIRKLSSSSPDAKLDEEEEQLLGAISSLDEERKKEIKLLAPGISDAISSNLSADLVKKFEGFRETVFAQIAKLHKTGFFDNDRAMIREETDTAMDIETNEVMGLPENDTSIRPGIEDITMTTQNSDAIATPENDATISHGIEGSTTISANSDGIITQETDVQARQTLLTPDTLIEESIPTDADPTMVRLRKEVGRDTLSLLPNLDTLTFKYIHQTQPGFLPLRLLIGTFLDETRPQLHDCEIWASFKMHDKGARAAPRMHVHAFRASTDDVINDHLKVNQVLPNLKMGPAFRGVHGEDRKEELQLKALVKYYFMLAASSKLLGFTKHHMPFNSSFVNELRIVCKRLQVHGSSRDDQRIEGRPAKRLKQIDSRTPRISSSQSDTDNDVTIAARTRDARRSGRRTQPPSRAVSESEDNVISFVPSIPLRIPRRLALGTYVPANEREFAINEYLAPDAKLIDSDGDSGDEIPAPIPADVHALLLKRQRINMGLDVQRESVRQFKAKKESATMGIRKIRGMINSTTDPFARQCLQNKLKLREQGLWCAQSQLAVHEGALAGFKKRRKEMNDEANRVDPRVVEIWEAMQ
ncbi:hypothetical protein N0V90_006124 [Kalmusia sp. IMI 367209]|nr:hypothetical protein N0V90_006124 [Kalmusia sp. IMI 367209]